MSPGDGWYLIGPLIAVIVVGLLGAMFWRMGLQWSLGYSDEDSLREAYPDGLAIFREPDDYGLLCDAGIRATQAVGGDGRVAVLVFAEEVEEARRLVGGSPAL